MRGLIHKILISIALLSVLVVSLSYSGLGDQFPPLRVREIDGSPNVRGVREIRVSNGTLTFISSGVVSIQTGGGGGTPGGNDTEVQFNDAGVFGGDAGLAYNKTTNFLTITSGGITLSSSTINKVTVTPPATGATFTLADGKTLTISNTITIAGTDGSTLNIGGGGTLGSNAFTSTAFVPQTTTVNGKALSGNITLLLASSDFANQGTTTTVLHGNAAGNPSFGVVTPSDASGNTSGSGNFVLVTSPTLVTPTLGVAVVTTLNGLTITTTTGTFTLTNGKTFSVSNSITIAGTDSTTMTFPSTSATIARTDAGQTFTGVQVMTTPTINGGTNAGIITSTGYSLTGSNATNGIDIAGTWNTTGNPVALQIAITNTASGATSKFVSFLAGAAGATEQFSIDKAGLVISTKNGAHAFTVVASGQSPVGFGRNSSVGGINLYGGEATPSDTNSDALIAPNVFRMLSSVVFGWSTTNVTQATTTGLSPVAAGILGIGTGAAASRAGWINWAGESRVSTQFDKTNDSTAANVTGLSIALQSGRTYQFEATLHVTADTTGGSKYNITYSSTNSAIIYEVLMIDDTSNLNTITSRQTASGGTVGQAGTTSGYVTITGTLTTTGAGNLTVQFAQNTATPATTSSVLVGSTMWAHDVP